MVSRATRDRRSAAVDATPDTEGHHVDWLFTRHDLGRNLVWGREFSLCVRAGSKLQLGIGVSNSHVTSSLSALAIFVVVISSCAITEESDKSAVSSTIFSRSFFLLKMSLSGFLSRLLKYQSCSS